MNKALTERFLSLLLQDVHNVYVTHHLNDPNRQCCFTIMYVYKMFGMNNHIKKEKSYTTRSALWDTAERFGTVQAQIEEGVLYAAFANVPLKPTQTVDTLATYRYPWHMPIFPIVQGVARIVPGLEDISGCACMVGNQHHIKHRKTQIVARMGLSLHSTNVARNLPSNANVKYNNKVTASVAHVQPSEAQPVSTKAIMYQLQQQNLAMQQMKIRQQIAAAATPVFGWSNAKWNKN